MLTSSSGDISFTEQRNPFFRRLFLALAFFSLIGVILMLTFGRGASDRVVGAGSTFAFPLIQRASAAYQTEKVGSTDWVGGSAGIEYEPVGSLGGILRLRDPEVDFAVSDYPLSKQEAASNNFVQFPIVVGSLSPVYNLGGAQLPPLKLRAATLADIYLGKVTNWSDPAIKESNPGAALPDLKIAVVHRSDGSGSTVNWTAYLSSGSEEWKAVHGSNVLIKWPVGTGAKGSQAMADAVKSTPGAIGYLETGQAQRAGLSLALAENSQKAFVEPTPATVAAGAQGMDWTTNVREGSAPAAAEAYPIVTAAHVIMKLSNTSRSDNERTLRFIKFLLEQRMDDAKSLGFLPLPSASVDGIRQVWAKELNYKS